LLARTVLFLFVETSLVCLASCAQPVSHLSLWVMDSFAVSFLPGYFLCCYAGCCSGDASIHSAALVSRVLLGVFHSNTLIPFHLPSNTVIPIPWCFLIHSFIHSSIPTFHLFLHSLIQSVIHLFIPPFHSPVNSSIQFSIRRTAYSTILQSNIGYI
jgi:hypothetical protein